MGTSYYAGTLTPGNFAATDLDGSVGTIAFRAVPAVNAFPVSNDEQCLISAAAADGDFEVYWDGIVGGGEQGYLALKVAGIEVARCYTYHVASDVLEIEVRWGGTPTRCELTVNGWCSNRRNHTGTLDAVDPTLPFTPGATIAVGQRQDTTAAWNGTIADLVISDSRLPTHWRMVALGDSLTQEPNGANLKAWTRRWATLSTGRGHAINSGRNGDRFTHLISRVTDEAIEYAPDVCFIICGINDIVAGSTAETIATQRNSLTATLAAAGIRVGMSTIYPFGNAAQYTAPREAVRITENAARLASPSNVDFVVDVGALLTEPESNPPALLAAYDFGDGLHLNQAGYDAVAAAVFAALWGAEATDASTTSTATATGAKTSTATATATVTSNAISTAAVTA